MILSNHVFFIWMSVTLVFGLLYWKRQVSLYRLPTPFAYDLYLIIILSALIGSRITHILFEEPHYYFQDPIKVFYLWNGGFVFYGGLLCSMAFGILFIHFKQPRLKQMFLEAATPVLSLSYAVGRFGCLWAGCCFGRACELPWAMGGRHPTQIYMIIWELGVWSTLMGIEKKRKGELTLFSTWLILHGLGRFIIEFYRGDPRGPIWILSLSSWISLLLIGLGFFLRFVKIR